MDGTQLLRVQLGNLGQVFPLASEGVLGRVLRSVN